MYGDTGTTQQSRMIRSEGPPEPKMTIMVMMIGINGGYDADILGFGDFNLSSFQLSRSEERC